jgi:hypothetical protein
MTASVPTEFPPYTFAWTTNATGNSITVNPTSTTDYGVIIKNSFGCAIQLSQTIKVEDIRDGDKNKVFICHNGHTQSVSVNAVPAFLAQGDQLGDCNPASINRSRNEDETAVQRSVSLYPNPAINETTISFTLDQDQLVSATVTDLQGRVVMKSTRKIYRAGRQMVNLNTSQLSNGTYLMQLSYGNAIAKIKFIVLR